MRNRLLQLLAENRDAPGRRFDVVKGEEGSDEATVYLYDVIVDDELMAEYWGGVAAAPFIKALHAIDAATIHLRVNSPGGSIFAARAIEQALREHKATIVAHIDGVAASAASFLVMGADEIVIARGGMVMVHKGWTWAVGNADELQKTVDLLNKIDGTLVQTYAERTGQAPEDIAAWLTAETWFTGEEAVQYGFADRLADGAAAGEPEASARWNLNAYLAALSRGVQAPAPSDSAAADLRARAQQRLRVLQLAAPIE